MVNEKLGPDHIRRFQSYLLQEKKLSPRSVVQRVSALRFLFVKTLKRHYMLEHLPFPKAPRRLPTVLSQDEVGRLIDSASKLKLEEIKVNQVYIRSQKEITFNKLVLPGGPRVAAIFFL